MVKYAATVWMYYLFGLAGLMILVGCGDITLLWTIIGSLLLIAFVIGQIIYYPKYLHYKKIHLKELEDKERRKQQKRNSIMAEYRYYTYKPKPKMDNSNNENDRYYYIIVIILIILLSRH